MTPLLYIRRKKKKQTPEHIKSALENAEWLMNKYTPAELNEYLHTLKNKVRRLKNQEIEIQENKLNQLKKLQP